MIFRLRFAMLFMVCVLFKTTFAVAQTPWDYKIISGEPYAFKFGTFIETQAKLTLSFSCIDGNKVVFGVHSNQVDFGPTGTLLKFKYSVDGANSKAFQMVSASGIIVSADVKSLARDTLGGNMMLISVSVPGGDFLHSKISLNGSDRAIKRVFADCRQTLSK